MGTFFHSFGFFEWLLTGITVGLFFLFLRQMTQNRQFARFLRLFFLLPILIPVFLAFFSPNPLSNREETDRSETARNSLFPAGDAKADLGRLTLKSDSSEEFAGNRSVPHFSTVSAKKGKTRFSAVSSPPTPRPIRVETDEAATPPSSVSDSTKNGSPKMTGQGEFSGQARPLASAGLLGYDGSQGSTIETSQPTPIYGGIKTAEWNAPPADNGIKPAGFRPDVPESPLHISLDKLDLTSDQSLALINRLTISIGQGVETTKQSVVHIEAKVRKEKKSGPREMEETGSGIIIMTRPGNFYVITNDHVAGNAVSNDAVSVTLYDKRVLHPVSVKSCPDFDIAVLQLNKNDLLPDSLRNADAKALKEVFAKPDMNLGWRPADLGNSDKVREIDSVLAIGSPFGLEGSVTRGIVSGLNRRQIPLPGSGYDIPPRPAGSSASLSDNAKQIQGFIQTDASINPGNSGGPLVNIRGEVIGIMIAIASKSGENTGVSFAIPINNAVHVAEQLIKNGVYERPYIGVRLDMQFGSMEKIAAGLLLDSAPLGQNMLIAKKAAGTRVRGVVPDSPAALAGLQEGDIILRYNEKVVEDEGHFENLICLSKLDESPKIEILRGDSRFVIRPKLTGRNRTVAQKDSSKGNY